LITKRVAKNLDICALAEIMLKLHIHTSYFHTYIQYILIIFLKILKNYAGNMMDKGYEKNSPKQFSQQLTWKNNLIFA